MVFWLLQGRRLGVWSLDPSGQPATCHVKLCYVSLQDIPRHLWNCASSLFSHGLWLAGLLKPSAFFSAPLTFEPKLLVWPSVGTSEQREASLYSSPPVVGREGTSWGRRPRRRSCPHGSTEGHAGKCHIPWWWGLFGSRAQNPGSDWNGIKTTQTFP